MEKFKVLTKDNLNDLSKTTGVYCFIESKNIIYIGKAVNIKDRVKNHFNQPSYRDNLFIQKVKKIGFINTNSEIEALVLEAQLIKKHLPKFNVVWRDDKNYFYVAVTKNEKPTVSITHQKKNGKTKYIGPFTEGNALKKTLKFLRKVFPYYTTEKHPKNNCTWCHLGLCPGSNPNVFEYKKNIKKLVLILQSKRKTVLYALRKEMAEFSKDNKFEEAGKIRDKISALEQVMAHANVIENNIKSENNHTAIIDGRRLLQYKHNWNVTQKVLQEILQVKTPISKIECFDISNIQGTQAVGSMAVFVNGAPDKSQYKKFRIRMENKPNDIAMLKEVLQRRLAHPEWGWPQVMLIDGGIAQLNIGIRVKKEFPLNPTAVENMRNVENIKIISIAKGKRELLIEGPALAKVSAGKAKKIPLKNLPQEIYNLIVHLDDEAHRFAITYHKKVRKKALLDI